MHVYVLKPLHRFHEDSINMGARGNGVCGIGNLDIRFGFSVSKTFGEVYCGFWVSSLSACVRVEGLLYIKQVEVISLSHFYVEFKYYKKIQGWTEDLEHRIASKVLTKKLKIKYFK
ncbi:unnamed protein product [Arctia plantaginis]|uniref:Uncharacterized protein n=1 Tax=Arctia plantaginis TaxID=874455 RepID=A0A8S1BHP0_ARCPL|nr:unnamed protein product [Arctia plantaginis]